MEHGVLCLLKLRLPVSSADSFQNSGFLDYFDRPLYCIIRAFK